MSNEQLESPSDDSRISDGQHIATTLTSTINPNVAQATALFIDGRNNVLLRY
uniref:Curli production assembly/transport component CsgE n=1 Tax=Loa loa TaxID=7209 RepID=A0A1I7VHX3_LOALO